MSPHYNVLPEAVCCCLLVNHVVYKHVTITSLLWLWIPTHPQNFKFAALGGTRTHDTLLSRQSALPTESELPGQLSKQGSKSTIQNKTRQSQTPILCAMT